MPAYSYSGLSAKGKNVKGRKRHLLVDTMGVLLAVVVTAASTSDPERAWVCDPEWTR